MNKVKIDKGIPLPGPRVNSGYVEVIKQMKEGDSFECPAVDRYSIYGAARSAHAKIAVRKTDNNLCRVWRIE